MDHNNFFMASTVECQSLPSIDALHDSPISTQSALIFLIDTWSTVGRGLSSVNRLVTVAIKNEDDFWMTVGQLWCGWSVSGVSIKVLMECWSGIGWVSIKGIDWQLTMDVLVTHDQTLKLTMNWGEGALHARSFSAASPQFSGTWSMFATLLFMYVGLIQNNCLHVTLTYMYLFYDLG